MQVPIEPHNKRLVCKTVEKHFDSAEVMFFHLLAFHYLGQPRKILGGRRERKRQKRIGAAVVEGVCVFAVVDRSPFSHRLGETVCRWRRVLKKKKGGGGSSPSENLAGGGGYTSLFISSYLKNFHIKRNEQQLLC